MYITQHTDYAFRVLIYTAVNTQDNQQLVNIATIAETYQISKSHLMKVVTALVKGGFLDSVRGKGGGLRLAKMPSEIKLGDIVRYLEPLAIVECMTDHNQCALGPSCRLAGIIAESTKQFLNHMDHFTLADLLNKSTAQLIAIPTEPK